LHLIDDDEITPRPTAPAPRPGLRLLRRDVYSELERRRRRAQIRARHLLDRDDRAS
jgi:hypothetical protein